MLLKLFQTMLNDRFFSKDIVNACETTKAIVKELDDDFFAILADADFYDKEQINLCLQYFNNRGEVVECFLGVVHVAFFKGVVHVANTTCVALKEVVKSKLMERSLSLSRVRSQGYNGASNMQGAINDLKL